MSIQQSKKQSDLEKRLQILRRQIYGKGSQKDSEKLSKPEYQRIRKSDSQQSDILRVRSSDLSGSLREASAQSHSEFSGNKSFRSDTAYLRQDLLKILTFSSAAVGIQLILFILLKNHILNVNIF